VPRDTLPLRGPAWCLIDGQDPQFLLLPRQDFSACIQHCDFPCFNGLVRTTIKTDNHILAIDAPRLIHSGEKGAVSD
jgi:hypothetical protein